MKNAGKHWFRWSIFYITYMHCLLTLLYGKRLIWIVNYIFSFWTSPYALIVFVRSLLKATLQRPTLPSRLPQEPTSRSRTTRTKRINSPHPPLTAQCTWDWSPRGTTWTFTRHPAHTVNSTTRRATTLPRRTPGCRGTEAGWRLAYGHHYTETSPACAWTLVNISHT